MSELSYLEKLLDGVEVEWLPLGTLGELVRGNGLPKTDFTESGVPAIHYGQIYTFYGACAFETNILTSLNKAAFSGVILVTLKSTLLSLLIISGIVSTIKSIASVIPSTAIKSANKEGLLLILPTST